MTRAALLGVVMGALLSLGAARACAQTSGTYVVLAPCAQGDEVLRSMIAMELRTSWRDLQPPDVMTSHDAVIEIGSEVCDEDATSVALIVRRVGAAEVTRALDLGRARGEARRRALALAVAEWMRWAADGARERRAQGEGAQGGGHDEQATGPEDAARTHEDPERHEGAGSARAHDDGHVAREEEVPGGRADGGRASDPTDAARTDRELQREEPGTARTDRELQREEPITARTDRELQREEPGAARTDRELQREEPVTAVHAEGVPDQGFDGAPADALSSPVAPRRSAPWAIELSGEGRLCSTPLTWLAGGRLGLGAPVLDDLLELRAELLVLGSDTQHGASAASALHLGGALGGSLVVARATGLQLALGARAELAYTRIAGRSQTLVASSVEGPSLALLGVLRGSVWIDPRAYVLASIEVGAAVLAVVGDVDGRSMLGTRGLVTSLAIGIGLAP